MAAGLRGAPLHHHNRTALRLAGHCRRAPQAARAPEKSPTPPANQFHCHLPPSKRRRKISRELDATTIGAALGGRRRLPLGGSGNRDRRIVPRLCARSLHRESKTNSFIS